MYIRVEGNIYIYNTVSNIIINSYLKSGHYRQWILFSYYRICWTYIYLVLVIHSVLSVSVNDFYSFDVENGDTRFIQTDVAAILTFSSFSITNLQKNENATATSALVC